MAQTDRLAVPLLASGQAQKEIIHNEALALLDLVVQPVVESADLASPPGSPAAGQCWIVASGATGAWLDRDDALAAWTGAGWLFAAPLPGWQAWVIDRSNGLRYGEAGWSDEPARADGYHVAGERVVGARQAAIADPAGGATQDVEGRGAILAILAALRSHGLIAG